MTIASFLHYFIFKVRLKTRSAMDGSLLPTYLPEHARSETTAKRLIQMTVSGSNLLVSPMCNIDQIHRLLVKLVADQVDKNVHFFPRQPALLG